MLFASSPWEKYFFFALSLAVIIYALIGFTRSTLGRYLGFHKPIQWTGGGSASLWGELAVYTFLLGFGIGFSGIIGDAWILLFPLMVIAALIGWLDQRHANKKAKEDGFVEDDQVEELAKEFDRLENIERAEKGYAPLPNKDSEKPEEDSLSDKDILLSVIMKWCALGPLILFGLFLALFFLGKVLHFDEKTTDLLWMLMSLSFMLLPFFFLGIPGLLFPLILAVALYKFIRDKEKTRVSLNRLIIGGAITVPFAFLGYIIATMVFQIALEIVSHLRQ